MLKKRVLHSFCQTLAIHSHIGVEERQQGPHLEGFKELHATKDIFGRYQITRTDLNEFIRKQTEKYNPNANEEV
jgi:hypothetical protein